MKTANAFCRSECAEVVSSPRWKPPPPPLLLTFSSSESSSAPLLSGVAGTVLLQTHVPPVSCWMRRKSQIEKAAAKVPSSLQDAGSTGNRKTFAGKILNRLWLLASLAEFWKNLNQGPGSTLLP